MKKVLIAGANSYIGTSVEKYLTEHYPNDFVFDTINMMEQDWIEKSFSGYDAVLLTAGIAHRKSTAQNAHLYYEINRDLAIETARKAKRDGVGQFILLSSMSVYGLLKGRITENTTPSANSDYGKSKLEAENGITPLNDENFKVCILRPPMVYGKGCKGNYVTLRKFALKLKMFPYVKNERSMLFIDNLSEFMGLMIKNCESGLFFPQNSEYVNTGRMVKAIAIVNGKKLRLVKGFGWAVKFMGLFTGLIKKAFGSLTYDMNMSEYKQDYNAADFNESIRRTEIE